MDPEPDARVTGQVNARKTIGGWLIRATDSWLNFSKPFVGCVDRAVLPWKRFFL